MTALVLAMETLRDAMAWTGWHRRAQGTGHRTQDARPQSPQSPQDSQGTFGFPPLWALRHPMPALDATKP